MGEGQTRQLPNILVCGTPGTGKTTLCELLVEETSNALQTRGLEGFEHLKVGELIQEHKLYTEWDDDYNVPIFDEDLLVDHLAPILESDKGGYLVDFHDPYLFEPGWFDIIILLHADTATLFRRLENRGYPERKIRENVECEIFQVIKEHVVESLEGKSDIAFLERTNDSLEEQQFIVQEVLKLIEKHVCKV